MILVDMVKPVSSEYLTSAVAPALDKVRNMAEITRDKQNQDNEQIQSMTEEINKFQYTQSGRIMNSLESLRTLGNSIDVLA